MNIKITALRSIGEVLTRIATPESLAAFRAKLERVDRLLASGQSDRVARARSWEDLR